MRHTSAVLGLGASLLLLASAPQAQVPANQIDPAAVRGAIERALATAPRGFQALQSPSQAGVRVVGVDVRQTSSTAQITVDLSQKTLTYDPSGDVEVLLDHVLASTAVLTGGERDVDYRFLVDGLPLEQFLSRIVSRPRVRPRALGSGGRVLVSGGHGWYWHADSGTWRLQRDYYWDIVEDVVNWEIATYLWEELRAARGKTAWPPGRPSFSRSHSWIRGVLTTRPCMMTCSSGSWRGRSGRGCRSGACVPIPVDSRP